MQYMFGFDQQKSDQKDKNKYYDKCLGWKVTSDSRVLEYLV